MMTKEFIYYIAGKKWIKNEELLEKDLILQQLLKELHNDKYFNKNFVFKGGTCIIKCYLGYYRFSEDLDFSWINQKILKYKSEKQKRKYLSNEINKILEILETIAKKLSLDFQKNKADRRYIELGGNNKLVTFKLYYISQISTIEQLIKIQINFVEIFKYKFKICKPKTIIDTKDFKEIKFLFPQDTKILTEEIKVKAYDIREILLEKFRAILTRQALKERDFIDIYFITKHLKTNIFEYKKLIIEKTIFMLKYEKYLRNLLKKEDFLKNFNLENKEKLLLKQTGEDFDDYFKKTIMFINNIMKEIKIT